MSLIEVKNIKKFFGENDNRVEALRGVDLKVEEGDMIAIMGPSGSGKSTLLNILGFLDKATEGEYYFDDKDVSKLKDKELAEFRNKYIGFVVQNFALIEDYTVSKNISLPLDYVKISSKEKKERIEGLLKMMRIEDKGKRLPKELSGGQNQRVAIARALVNNPKVILADEPTGALDSKNGQEVMKIFKRLNEKGKTIIVITHDEKVASMCKKTIYIEDGKIKERSV